MIPKTPTLSRPPRATFSSPVHIGAFSAVASPLACEEAIRSQPQTSQRKGSPENSRIALHLSQGDFTCLYPATVPDLGKTRYGPRYGCEATRQLMVGCDSSLFSHF